MRETRTRKVALAGLLLSAVLLVAACGGNGTAGTPDDNLVPEPAPGDAAVENGRDGGAEGPVGEEEDTGAGGGNDAIVGQPATGEPPPPTKEVEIEVEGMQETRTGTLAVSDNGYHLYVIPPFVFTAEEPGADVLYMEAYPDYMMRIQAMPGDADLDLLRENAEEELVSISGSFEERQGDEIYDPYLRGAAFYLQSVDEEMVKKIIVMEIDGLVFRFTMFLPVGGEASEGAESGFNAMIKTIRAN